VSEKNYATKPRKANWRETAEAVVDAADAVVTVLGRGVGSLLYSSHAGAKGLDDIPYDKHPPILKRKDKNKKD